MDILTSLASLVAITTVLISWYRSAQKPLKIEKVVVHRKEKGSIYFLVVKNRKPYPVEIKSTNCYTKRTYNVEQKNSQRPEYSALLNLADSPFQNTKTLEIAANGHTNLKVEGNTIDGEISKLLFTMRTSHGYHELWCRDITVVEADSYEMYEVDYRYEYESMFKAKAKYYWLKIKALAK